jgi:hypothetical protein
MVVQIDLNGSISGTPDKVLGYSNDYVIDDIQFFNAPDDYTFERYTYTPIVSGVFNPNGFTAVIIPETINFSQRQSNINQMNSYMDSLRLEGALTQANFDLFLSDTATNVQVYLSGGGRLITWIETVNRNGYNATTTGFKTKTSYRGTLVNGLYPRAEMILSILNNL